MTNPTLFIITFETGESTAPYWDEYRIVDMHEEITEPSFYKALKAVGYGEDDDYENVVDNALKLLKVDWSSLRMPTTLMSVRHFNIQ